MSFATPWTNLEIVTQSQKRKTNIMQYCLYVKSRKMVQMNLLAKQKYTGVEDNLWLPRGGGLVG